MTARLSRSTPLPAAYDAPVAPEGAGIVHLGAGAFHRAHQAVYTQEAMRASGSREWGIVAVTQRSRRVVDELAPQDGLYGVRTVGDVSRLDVIGSIVEVLAPLDDTAQILRRLASPQIHVVTVTATEAAYPTGDDGGLDVDVVRADLAALSAEHAGDEPGRRPGSSMIGLLARGLAARHRAGGAPLTVISCDNLSGNGRLLQRLVSDALRAALGPDAGAVLGWLDAHAAFPDSMVDRITPAPTPGLRAEVARLLGVEDRGAVAAEPFRQWVIENRFAGPRPAWELAGATLTADVGPYEEVKLRLLNGTHSVLAFGGAIAGHRTIDEAVADEGVLVAARRYLADAVAHTTPPRDVDLPAYAQTLLERFANSALGHTVGKVSTDGSLKIPQRWGPVAEQALRAGVVPEGVAGAFAVWVRFVRERRDLVVDPRRDELLALAGTGSPEAALRALLRSGVLPRAVAADERFVAAAVAALTETGGRRR